MSTLQAPELEYRDNGRSFAVAHAICVAAALYEHAISTEELETSGAVQAVAMLLPTAMTRACPVSFAGAYESDQ